MIRKLNTLWERAEKAEARVRELEGEIEHHRAEVENLNDSRLSTESYLAGLYEADEELWATLEGGEESGAEDER